jgi:hypothetical protein
MSEEVKGSATPWVFLSFAFGGGTYALFSMWRDGVEVIWLIALLLLITALLTAVPLPSGKPLRQKSGQSRERTWNEKIWWVAFFGPLMLGGMDVG